MPVPGAQLELNARSNPRIAAAPVEWENLGVAGGWLTRELCCGAQDPVHGISPKGIAFYSGAGRLTSLGRVDQTQGGSGLVGEPQLFLKDFTVEIWARLSGPDRSGGYELFGMRSAADLQVFSVGLDVNTDEVRISNLAGTDGMGIRHAKASEARSFPRDNAFHQLVATWNNTDQIMTIWLDASDQPIYFHDYQSKVGWDPGIPMTMVSIFASSSLESKQSFNGDVSLVRVYDWALTLPEIKANFRAGPNSTLPLPLEPFRDFLFDFENLDSGVDVLNPAPAEDDKWFQTYTVSARPLRVADMEGPNSTEHFLRGSNNGLGGEVGYLHGVLAEQQTYKFQTHVCAGNAAGFTLLSAAPGYGFGAAWGLRRQNEVIGPGVSTLLEVQQGDWVGLELVVTKVPGGPDILQTNYQIEGFPKVYGPKVPGEMRVGAWVLSSGGNCAVDNFRGFSLGNRIDSDGDGLSDIWEEQFFNSPFAVSPLADEDNDGSNNLEEFIADTIPVNHASVFRISAFHKFDGWSVRFPASPKRTYWLEYMDKASAGDRIFDKTRQWRILGLGTAGRGFPLSLSDPNAPPTRIYRVRVD